MSDTNDIPVRKKHLRNPKTPSLQKKMKFSSELDLWNLEEDLEPLNLESSRLEASRQVNLPAIQKSEINEDNTNEPELSNTINDDTQDIPLVCVDRDTPIISAKNRFTPNKKVILQEETADKVSESNDLWEELDDRKESVNEEESVTHEVIAESKKSNEKQETIEEKPSKPRLPQNTSPKKKSILDNIDAQATPAMEAPKDAIAEEEQKVEASEMMPSIASEIHPTPTPVAKKKSFISGMSALEKCASAFFLLLLISLVTGGAIMLSKNLPESSDLYAMPKFPIVGQYVTVDSIETYWRAPIKSGANADPVQLKVISIPEIEIRIMKDSPTKGSLRVKFLDSDGKIIGDTMTKSLTSESFQKDREGKFACTAGFKSEEEIDTYLASTKDPWRLEVYEAPQSDAPPQNYKLLFSAPISKTQK